MKNPPKTIEVTIKPEEVFDSKIYEDPENCYIAKSLKQLGYSNICLDMQYARIDNHEYKPDHYVGAVVLSNNFKNNLETKIVYTMI